MIFKRIFIAFTLLTHFSIKGFEQTNITIAENFIKTIPPKVWSDKWYPLNHSHNEFGVSVANSKLDIKKVKEVNKCELKMTGGTLIGLNRGEWGGQLTFKPDDTTKKTVDIKRGNIKFIFNFKDKIYFIEGLAHMDYSGGAIFQLNTANNSFTFTKLVDFNDAPEAFTIYNDKFLIATDENFYIVNDFKKELVFKETFWSSLYPNSIAVLDYKNVFLGMRSGIVKLDLSTKTMKFYKYKG